MVVVDVTVASLPFPYIGILNTVNVSFIMSYMEQHAGMMWKKKELYTHSKGITSLFPDVLVY